MEIQVRGIRGTVPGGQEKDGEALLPYVIIVSRKRSCDYLLRALDLQ